MPLSNNYLNYRNKCIKNQYKCINCFDNDFLCANEEKFL